MGLEGRLEDLPLIELLQIVAFSKKSGYLRVKGEPGRGVVIVEDGKVLFACSWRTLGLLRELASDSKRITPEGNRANVECALKDLSQLTKGTFRFELTSVISDELRGVPIGRFMVKDGLDPQEVLLDLAVEMDHEGQNTTTLIELAFRDAPLPDEAGLTPDDTAGSHDESADAPPSGDVDPSLEMLDSGAEAAQVPEVTSGVGEHGSEREALVTRMTRKLLESGGARDISGLVLRVAERFVERGVLLCVRDETAHGVAGFGFAEVASECAAVSRRIALDLSETAVLNGMLSSETTRRLQDPLAESVGAVVEALGVDRASEAVLVPIRADGAVMLLLYGDNGVTGGPLPAIEDLELFVAQAGMALENKLLQRRLAEMKDPVEAPA